MTHSAGSEPGVVEAEESGFEMVVAAITVGLAWEEADLDVGAFQQAGGDRVVGAVQQSDAMSALPVVHGVEDSDAGGPFADLLKALLKRIAEKRQSVQSL